MLYLFVLNATVVSLIDAALYMIPVWIIIILRFKCPVTNDKIFIYYEFRKSSFIFGSTFFLYLLVQLLTIISDEITTLAEGFVGVYVLCGIIFVILYLVPNKIKNNGGFRLNQELNSGISSNYNIDDSRTIGSKQDIGIQLVEQQNQNNSRGHSKNKKSKKLKLTNILQIQETLEMFIGHLIHEFSIEVILSFIELLQFKYIVKDITLLKYDNNNNNGYNENDNLNGTNNNNNNQTGYNGIIRNRRSTIGDDYNNNNNNINELDRREIWMIKLPENVPNSTIVYDILFDENKNKKIKLNEYCKKQTNEEIIDDLKEVIFKLYTKYIKKRDAYNFKLILI